MNGFWTAGKRAALALASMALLVPPGLAFAEHREGPYAGATDQSQAIKFRVADGRVKRLEVAIYADCADGTRQKVTVTGGRTRLDGARFSLELTGEKDLEVTVAGRLRASQATGSVKASLKPANTVCTAESRWHATPKAAAPS